MGNVAFDPRLQPFVDVLAGLQWSAMVIDSQWRLVWASDELKEFAGATDAAELGYGLHIAEALTKDPWLPGIHPDSLPGLLKDVGPYLLYDLAERGITPEDVLPGQIREIIEALSLEPKPPPTILPLHFLSLEPDQPELPPVPVDICCLRMQDDEGLTLAWLAIFFMSIRPNLAALLARGDENMYERMARLTEPRSRQGALLFCDLHASGEISKRLPSIQYFKLIRRLWTGIDDAVANNSGIIGKHAGDGASAYFLIDDLETPSKAAAAAIRTAGRIHEVSEEVFRDVLDSECLMKVGVHWGGTMFMGQLVPGGRLDVSALGDEVNEAARIQQATDPGETVASKQLLEQLHEDQAAELGIDLEKIVYRTLGEIAPDIAKVVRDAAALPVTTL